jgi:prepilin-type N-terminal cleavage/methylation domain-containing protein
VKAHRQGGFTLLEMLTVVAIVGMIVGVSLPAFESMRRRNAVRVATADIRAIFHLARNRAITRGVNTGIKFFRDTEGNWVFAMYDDGDGDGVRSNDIVSGVDRLVTRPKPVLSTIGIASISLPMRPIAHPDGGWLSVSASPVNFNASTICSFSPRGTCTPGTMFLSDRWSEVWAVRAYGATAKLRIMKYDFRAARWEAR